jgi:oligosaccharide repeat unit polymerase
MAVALQYNQVQTGSKNVFVDVPRVIRVIVFVYWLLYGCIANFYSLVYNGNTDFQDILFALLKSTHDFIIYLPIIIAIKNTGLLHPLLFPGLFGLVKNKAVDPFSLITDLIAPENIYESSYALSNHADVVRANYQYISMDIIAMLIFYVSILSVKFKPRPATYNTTVNRNRLFITVSVGLMIFAGFFISQGGIKAYIDSWGLEGGRQEVIEGEDLGVLAVFLRSLYFITVAWYLSAKGNSAFKNPFFIGSGIIFLFSGFLATGSRSAVFSVMVIVLTIYVFKNRRIPVKTIAITAFFALIVFGTLGRLRSSATGNGTAADWNVLDPQSFVDNLNYAIQEGAKRKAENPHIVAFAKVPQDVDYLYGKSFASVLLAWVPRSIWPDKPHTGAYYCGYDLFGVYWGIPIGGVAEIFWNFSYLGVVLIYFLWGRLTGFITAYCREFYWAPGIATLYFMFLLDGISLSSLTLSGLLQKMVLTLIGLKFMKLI